MPFNFTPAAFGGGLGSLNTLMANQFQGQQLLQQLQAAKQQQEYQKQQMALQQQEQQMNALKLAALPGQIQAEQTKTQQDIALGKINVATAEKQQKEANLPQDIKDLAAQYQQAKAAQDTETMNKINSTLTADQKSNWDLALDATQSVYDTAVKQQNEVALKNMEIKGKLLEDSINKAADYKKEGLIQAGENYRANLSSETNKIVARINKSGSISQTDKAIYDSYQKDLSSSTTRYNLLLKDFNTNLSTAKAGLAKLGISYDPKLGLADPTIYQNLLKITAGKGATPQDRAKQNTAGQVLKSFDQLNSIQPSLDAAGQAMQSAKAGRDSYLNKYKRANESGAQVNKITLSAPLQSQINQVAQKYGVNPRLMMAVIQSESGGNPTASGDQDNPVKGASSFGLGQINSYYHPEDFKRIKALGSKGVQAQLEWIAQRLQGKTPDQAAEIFHGLDRVDPAVYSDNSVATSNATPSIQPSANQPAPKGNPNDPSSYF